MVQPQVPWSGSLLRSCCLHSYGGDCLGSRAISPGDYPDISIFRHALIFMLDDGERVEADDGYRGEYPRHCKIPDPLDTVSAAIMRQRVMQRHETVNKRFKNFGCLKQVFRHNLLFHSSCFRAVAVVTQMAFNNGEPVFQVDYDDRQA